MFLKAKRQQEQPNFVKSKYYFKYTNCLSEAPALN